MTVEQFESALGQFGQQLNNLDAHLLTIGGELVAQLKAIAPEDTGALKSSLQAVVDQNQLKIQMLYYGMFQNYGVSGTEDSLGIAVPEGIDPKPTSGEKYTFKTRQFGIPAQHFFNLQQLEQQVATRLDQLLQQDLNNIN
jgi:hypothetical protein